MSYTTSNLCMGCDARIAKEANSFAAADRLVFAESREKGWEELRIRVGRTVPAWLCPDCLAEIRAAERMKIAARFVTEPRCNPHAPPEPRTGAHS